MYSIFTYQSFKQVENKRFSQDWSRDHVTTSRATNKIENWYSGMIYMCNNMRSFIMATAYLIV